MRPPSPSQTTPLSPTMASRSPSPITSRRRRSKTQSNEQALNPSFADLPSSLLETIMSRIVLKDNIRASAACKSWHEAAIYVRVVEKHPWLMCFPKFGGGNLFQFRDPVQSKSFTLELPGRSFSLEPDEIFFFNPFSKERISLPVLEPTLKFIRSHELAFTCPPTSDDCVLLASFCDYQRVNVTLRTWCPGATEWSIITHEDAGWFGFFGKYGKLVYLNDRFYILNSTSLHSFHPSSGTWEHRPTTRLHDHNDGQRQRYGRGPNETTFYLAEKRGEVILLVTCNKEKPKVYKLVSLEWKEMSDAELDGLTFFVSLYNCELRSDLTCMRNRVYFSRSGGNRKHCAYYSFDENSFTSYNASHYRGLELCSRNSVWIDPPSNVLDYFVSESFA
ncbi:unnamed protein product [Microthlaspi erraticum]|uniref:F-box domain-containing protein n=1 Tax=Microthlaspi erraticum TaxID=1685480 RepID=A0A6D2IQY0_9BRAS|nr:unnamed protein product [Microthlaspi erraticum]